MTVSEYTYNRLEIPKMLSKNFRLLAFVTAGILLLVSAKLFNDNHPRASSIRSIPVQLKKDHSLNTHNDIFDSVKKLLLFVGWPRSCHSFVGSILDGHPHVIMAYGYRLMTKLQEGRLPMQRDLIIAELYNVSINSFKSATNMRTKTEHLKGYPLIFEDLMQGQFEDHIDIIGDKSG